MILQAETLQPASPGHSYFSGTSCPPRAPFSFGVVLGRQKNASENDPSAEHKLSLQMTNNFKAETLHLHDVI